MKTNKFLWALPCLTMLFAATFSSCSENNDQPVPQSQSKHHFLMSAQSDNSFFITGFENFNEGTSVTCNKAVTLPTGHLFMEKRGKYVYLQSGSMYGYGGEQTLYKYEVDANGKLSAQPAGKLSDRKSTRLNSSHANISYAVFCLKKKKKQLTITSQIII